MKSIIIILFLFAVSIKGQENGCVTYFDVKSGKECLIGVCEKSVFQDSLFSQWYNQEYKDYVVEIESEDSLKSKLADVEIKIVMGTWCSDSRREVPRFIKILDELKFPANKLTIINVNRDKEGLYDETNGLNIKFVPTFIFYRAGVEIGRIIEVPLTTLEKDTFEIVRN